MEAASSVVDDDVLKKLKEYSSLLDKSQKFSDLIRKMEQNRKDDSDPIFRRVHNDYKQQKEEVDNLLSQERDNFINDYKELHSQNQQVQSKYRQLKDRLKELNFRYVLGEYSERDIEEEGNQLMSEVFDHIKKLSLLEEVMYLYLNMLDFDTKPEAGTAVMPEAQQPVEQASFSSPGGQDEFASQAEQASQDSPLYQEAQEIQDAEQISQEEHLDQEVAPVPEEPDRNEEKAVTEDISINVSEGQEDGCDSELIEDETTSQILPIVTEKNEEGVQQATKSGIDDKVTSGEPNERLPAEKIVPRRGRQTGAWIPPEGQLVILEGSRKDESVSLVSGDVLFGSSPGTDVLLDDYGVAEAHARIFFKDNKYYLKNLDAEGHSYVNGIQKNLVELNDGDVVRFGNTVRMRLDLS